MPRLPLAAFAVALCALAGVGPAPADGPKDNIPDNVRPIPPKGVAVPETDAKELKAGLDELKTELDALPAALKGKPALLDLLPDVEVYHKAVRYAVENGEFFPGRDKAGKDLPTSRDVAAAKGLLKNGIERAKQLKDGKPAWPTATGLVVRGYRSKIDGSVQPYGLVVPATYSPGSPRRHRLDFWWHGRGETLSEVNFITQRQATPGEFTPPDAFVLHPYGRYCNANKFAGEIDTLECLDHAKKHYPIDDARIAARGFSMGGAACWQFAVHYPSLFAAAAPGAGFSETPEFLNVFQNEKVEPTWYEKKLWHMYNATDYAGNLLNLPTVAYSGEIDKQKQAADVMARELKKVGIELTHVIGPKTGHSYHPEAKQEVNRRIDAIMAKGRDPVPEKVQFITFTLRYNRCAWLSVDGLGKHWEAAHVAADLRNNTLVNTAPVRVNVMPVILTRNVTRLSLHFGPGEWVYGRRLAVDKSLVELPPSASDRSLTARLVRTDDKWQLAADKEDGLAKKPGLQGPIDDAFMDRFLMVRPTGAPLHEKVGAWAAGEMRHAVEHWRKQFRGDAPVADDHAVTDADIASSNLILWGDPSSNKVLAKIADKLPVKWTKDGVMLGDKTYPAETHVPVLVFPNPLNPAKYMVLNSGFTYREYDYLNNARQVPKLPDYAVVDVTTPPNARYPGKVVRAGFFGEAWELLPNDGQGGSP